MITDNGIRKDRASLQSHASSDLDPGTKHHIRADNRARINLSSLSLESMISNNQVAHRIAQDVSSVHPFTLCRIRHQGGMCRREMGEV